jgi:hypothetical protein
VLFPGCNFYIMALVNALDGGVAQKTADNKTYRMVRGRIIVSRKRVSGETGAITRGLGGNIRKPLFAMINSYMSQHKTDIQVSFNKSKYGSQRNYFFTVNYTALSQALNSLALSAAATGVMPLESEVESAINTYVTANPTSVYRVKLAGFDNVFMSGAWDSNDNPIAGGSTDGLGTGTASFTVSDQGYTAPIALSLSKHNGAKMVHGAVQINLLAANLPTSVVAADLVYYNESGALATQPTISNVTSAAGSLTYDVTALASSDDAVALSVKGVFIRLTSAYVASGGEVDPNPLG